MKKSQRLWVIISVLLIVIGAVIFVGAMSMLDFDFRGLSTENYQTNNYKISADFDKISIDTLTADVVFAMSPDQSCEVVCYEQEKVRHTVVVEEQTLVINTVDTRKWYEHIGISFENASITVYLPKKEYISLGFESDIGDIDIPKEVSFAEATIESDTGEVNFEASLTETLNISGDTGNINLNGVSASVLKLETDTGNINITSANIISLVQIETDTGDVELENVKTDKLDVNGNTGKITFSDSVAKNSISVENDTGDVVFDKSDAASIFVKTSTGDVKGSLLSEKIFLTETSTGDVSVPKTSSGGKCEIITSTGDIELSIN